MQLNRVSKIDDKVLINNVLISVADKTDLEGLVKELVQINPEINIFSTGGTFSRISKILGGNHYKNLKSVSEYTGQPEMQGGLVKTLDFKIYLGLLSETYNEAHKDDLKRTDAIAIDMVIVNLYPFKETIAQKGVTLEDARANIDIGGPCMLRASAKNFLRVVSICDPADYKTVLDEMKKNNGNVSLKSRLNFAKKTFSHTAAYDTAIAEYLLNQDGKGVYNV